MPCSHKEEMDALCQHIVETLDTSRAPLALLSNKSCFGHTEGAAGLTGFLLAAASAAHSAHDFVCLWNWTQS
jgi:3-oxoacyl-(acyl-carrier-protein) synthase